ncbi:MAG TPA: GGDEF domain-containing protein [Rhizomicrobium sp.]
MSECAVAPTPENFELFYHYATGGDPQVASLMGEMLSRRIPFTQQVLDHLRSECLTSAREKQAIDAMGDGVSHALANVLERIGDAGRDAKAYGQTLIAAHGEFEAEQPPETMRKVIDGLRAATRAMEQRTRALEGELQRSSTEIAELKAKLDDVRRESLIDPLTGVFNRKAFDVELENAGAQSAETGEPVSLLMCDIDHFKQFNDTWGHQTGDQVLRLVANCLSENVKGRDTAARYGGEEFAVILRNTELAHAITLADQIRANVEGKKLVKKSTGDILGRMTISIGVAQLAATEQPGDLVQRADACLYAAKHNGRNLVLGEHDPRVTQAATVAA